MKEDLPFKVVRSNGTDEVRASEAGERAKWERAV
jgi:hypothetical protein